jgi:dTDP-4-dehydrorhamnose 3,5-epimerase
MEWEPPRLVKVDRYVDRRGGFVTPWDRAATPDGFSPDSLHFSHNPEAGTLRGLHRQTPPHEQAKLVSCVRGRVFDVVVDLRLGSPGYRQWTAFWLEPMSDDALQIPRGFAHGFLTLEPDTILCYLISGAYAPAAASGLRWDDPTLAIEWPAPPRVISDKDRNWPALVS